MSSSDSDMIAFTEPFHKALLRRFRSLPNLIFVTVLAVIIGIGAGYGALLTEWLVETIHHIFFEEKLWGLLDGLGMYHLLLAPAIGALIFAPIILIFTRDAKGHGVSEVLEAVSVHGGRIRPRIGFIKSLTSTICIGSGGSVGLEGPISQIGATIGSAIGQLVTLSEDRLRLLLACGAGAGIAATFHAPFTGTLFALEIILGHIEAGYLSAIVISAVVADTVAQGYKEPIIGAIPDYMLFSHWELLLYAILGVVVALSSVAFTKTMHTMEKVWRKVPISDYLKPALGGLFLGMIGMITFFHADNGVPHFYGLGYESIANALNGTLPLTLVFSLFLIKIFTTSLTLGSGGMGGTFTPTLFMGIMLGSSFGYVANMLFPEITQGGYALAGMAAFFGAAAHAPFTAIMVPFELSGYNHHMILPIMLTTVVATLVAQTISPHSMYTSSLVRQGIKVRRGAPGQELYVMDSITVGEAMSKEIDTVPSTMPLFHLMEQFDQTHRHGFPVVDSMGELVGVVSIRDLDTAIAAGNLSRRTVGDIATKDLLVAYPSEPMGAALQRLSIREISRLPVVEAEGSRKLVGMVLRSDIIHAYNKALVKRGTQKTES